MSIVFYPSPFHVSHNESVANIFEMKMDLVIKILDLIYNFRWSIAEASQHLSEPIGKILNIKKGKIEKLTVDDLLTILGKLNVTISWEFKESTKSKQPTAYPEFTISKINNKDFQFLVFSNSFLCLDEYYKNLENELKAFGACTILLDLLLSNGFSERYFKINFDGNALDLQSIEKVPFVDHAVYVFSCKYFKNHPQFVDNSNLTRPQKFLVKRGRFIKSLIRKEVST